MSIPLPPEIEILFVAGFGPIVTNNAASRKLYEHTLGIRFENEYACTENISGVKHFGLWPIEMAAESCFGSPQWPATHPVPQAWLEFDVADIHKASLALEKAGYTLLTNCKEEPWGQTVSRFLSPEGILLAVTHTPHQRQST